MAVGYQVRYKQRCFKCKKNYVVAIWKQKYVVCYDCQKGELEGKIKDPEMRRLFDIPEEYYKENAFLRNIKIAYLKFGKLSEKQVESFKKTVEKMKLGVHNN